jgi:hypothetical protein
MPAITTEVRVPTGPIPKTTILQTAIRQVRNELPATTKVDATITAHRRDGDQAIFTVTVNYLERGAANPEPVLAGVFGAAEADTEDDRDGVDKALDDSTEQIKRAVRRATKD